ncbi:hypothetical protein PR202_ga20764 [Eleusine coracana subsp. coracana]|uniref:Uncharacterized protein n=1 Tax=Eleusine coracana subsp. coracana TaxID=191504 RepID=A0AAV5CXY7_ELECO|nr:hypothetical protein PR202_ga20764 [Eleusine coracana subsp. coracana]
MKNLRGEVRLNIPADKAWEMFTNNETVAKINPEMLASAEYLEGDGSPGSLRIFRLGTDKTECTNLNIELIILDDLSVGLHKLQHCITLYRNMSRRLKRLSRVGISVMKSVAASAQTVFQTLIAGWKAEFDLINPPAPLPENAKDAALGFLKLFESCRASK